MQRPLVTSDIDFARELCGDAALFAGPHDPAAFAGALDAIARDTGFSQQLVEAGLEQLKDTYPTADQKFRSQLRILYRVCENSA